MRDWQAAQQDKAATTQQVHLTALRGFMKWLIEEDMLSEDPTARLHAPRARAGIVTPLTSAASKITCTSRAACPRGKRSAA